MWLLCVAAAGGLLVSCTTRDEEPAASEPDSAVTTETPTTSQADAESAVERNADERTADDSNVVEVVDGDTIDVRVDGVVERVRLIGINSPERDECFEAEATEALRAAIDGETVRLESDVTDRDQFGRLLRYVYVDDVFVNESLVAGGFAIARRYEPDTAMAELLEAAQERAQSDAAGLWAADACGESVEGLDIVITEIEFDAPGDDGQNLNGEWLVLRNASEGAVDMSGWVLRDESASHRFSFPDGFELEPNGSVQVFSGCGTDTATELFWCTTGSAIWNNGGDTAFVLDANGTIVTSLSY